MALCQIHEIELEGFKVFKERHKIGPFRTLSCIIGPNGCGKSCLVEAIAFVLVGKSSLIRNQGVQSLINQDRAKNENFTAQDNEEQFLSVRRTITKSRTAIYTHNGEESWKPQTQASLAKMLLEFQIQVEVIERYIVVQSRQPMSVCNPFNLLKFMECCLGTLSLQNEISSMVASQQLHRDRSQSCQVEIQELEQLRQKNEPMLKKFEEYTHKIQELDLRRLNYAKVHIQHLLTQLISNAKKIARILKQAQLLEDKESNCQGKMIAAEQELQQAQSALSGSVSCMKEIKSKHEAGRLELCKLTTRRSFLEERLAELQDLEDLCSLEEKEVQLRKEIEVSSCKLQSLDVELKHKDRTLEETRTQGEGARDYDRCRKTLDQKKNAMKTLSARLQSMHESLSIKKERKKVIQTEIQNIEDELCKHQDQYSLKETEFKSVAQNMDSEKKDLKTVQNHLKKTKDELDQIQKQLTAKTKLPTDCSKQFSLYDHALSQRGVFGRLMNIACVKEQQYVTPVNAVLRQLVSLHSFLLVANASTAISVIQYFTENRIGLVTCSIVQETPQTIPRNFANSLLNFIAVSKQCFQSVVHRLLGNWILVEDSEEAIRIKSMSRIPLNLVTKSGEVFFASGVVKRPGIVSSAAAKYFIQTNYQPIHTPAISIPTPSNPLQSSNLEHNLESKEQSLVQVVEEMRKQTWEIRRIIEESKINLEAMQSQMEKLQDQYKEKKRKLASLNVEQHSLEQELAELDIESITTNLSQLKSEFHSLRSQLGDCNLRLEVEEEVDEIILKKEQVSFHLDGLKQGWNEVKALVEATMVEIKKKEDIIEKLKMVEVQIQQSQSRISLLEIHLSKEKSSFQEVKKQMIECQRVYDLESRRHQEVENEIFKEHKIIIQVHKNIQNQMDELESDIKILEENKETSEETKKVKKLLYESRRILITVFTSPKNFTCSEVEALDLTTSLQSLKDVIKDSPLLQMPAVDSPELDFDVESLMIAAEEERLKKLFQTIDSATLQADLQHCRRIHELQTEQSQEDELIQADSSKIEDLERKRFVQLMEGLDSVNSRLQEVYKLLTDEQGSVSLSYSQNPRMLAQHGIAFHCRPNAACNPSGNFALLSVGQQCMATLALSFAIQESFPSPFYFYDEMDCALDVNNAVRVIHYIKKQSNAQYFIISHKPFVFEQAESLIGIFGSVQGTSMVLLDCQEEKEDKLEVNS